jgi:hypothetical protein
MYNSPSCDLISFLYLKYLNVCFKLWETLCPLIDLLYYIVLLAPPAMD